MDNWIARSAAPASASADQAQQQAAFSLRVAENQRRVFHIAYGVLANRADAEDVAQETFLRAFQKFSSLRESEKFRAWVNRIAFRLALNRQRAIRRRLVRDDAWHAVGPADAVDEASNAERRLLLARLRREMDVLPGKLRRVLQLSVVEDMQAHDVGAVLGIPSGTVRSRLHAARKLLLEAMK